MSCLLSFPLNTNNPKPSKIIPEDIIFTGVSTSSKSMTDPKKPKIGTNNDMGATVEMGYFFNKLFQTQ